MKLALAVPVVALVLWGCADNGDQSAQSTTTSVLERTSSSESPASSTLDVQLAAEEAMPTGVELEWQTELFDALCVGHVPEELPGPWIEGWAYVSRMDEDAAVALKAKIQDAFVTLGDGVTEGDLEVFQGDGFLGSVYGRPLGDDVVLDVSVSIRVPPDGVPAGWDVQSLGQCDELNPLPPAP